jgi:hypothetical protein
MTSTRFWETPDQLITISTCSEGCVHVRVGRAIIKLVPEEFLALAKLTDKAVRELHGLDSSVLQRPMTGH